MPKLTWDEINDILANISYRDWAIELKYIDKDISLFRWTFDDNGTTQYGRWWVVDSNQPHSDIVRSAMKGVLVAEEHESREKFRYRGKKIFNPHFDAERLVEIAGKKDNLEIPEPIVTR